MKRTREGYVGIALGLKCGITKQNNLFCPLSSIGLEHDSSKVGVSGSSPEGDINFWR